MITTTQPSQKFSISLGNLLFRNFFPVYNFIYPIFKRRQDADEIAFLKQTIKKGDVVLDIGANIGFYSKILAELVGENGKVYCFEPDKVNYDHFLKNIKGIQNINAINRAVAEQTKTLKLYTSKMLNVDHRTYKVDDYENEITIEAVSVDDFVANTFKVDFIKMDIQGFEVAALLGMKNTLLKNKNIKILTEFWPFGLKKSGYSAQQFYTFLKELGFKIFLISGGHQTPIDETNIESYASLAEGIYFNVLITV